MSTLIHLVTDLKDPRFRKYAVATASFALLILTMALPDVPTQDKVYVMAAIGLLNALGIKRVPNQQAPPAP